ncbi:MAG TPA: retron system putative HNH endonuclease [Thermoanaerobaculia bacterium]|nr:retron system putative HNH endonuclease [Thermoanaerobaculia bacterium]
MIRVKRGDAPACLLDDGAAGRERRKAEELRKKHPKKSFPFKVYASEEVKLALERLFRGKCAYCETRYAASQPMDVEHWRPKSQYPWAASDWDNLLPSCIDCNRQRYQLLVDERKKVRAGKGTLFPLAKGSKRATSRAAMAREVPLLLHPANDDPDEHLRYTEEAVVRARRNSEKAPESIRVYALNRSALVDERLQLLLLLRHRMHTIAVLIDLLDRSTGRTAELIEDLLIHEMTELHAFAHPARPYSAMARHFIKEFAKTIEHSRLTSDSIR